MRSLTWGLPTPEPAQHLLTEPWASSACLGCAHSGRVSSLARPRAWTPAPGPGPQAWGGFPAWAHLHGPAQRSPHRSPTLTHRMTSRLHLGPPSLLPCDLGWQQEPATISGPALPAAFPAPRELAAVAVPWQHRCLQAWPTAPPAALSTKVNC